MNCTRKDKNKITIGMDLNKNVIEFRCSFATATNTLYIVKIRAMYIHIDIDIYTGFVICMRKV